MKNRIGIYLLTTAAVFLLLLTSCTSQVIVTSTISVTHTITETVTEPAETITVTTSITSSSGDQLEVHFIDVGQGDSILIDLDEVEVLIDGGDKSPGVVTYIDDYVDGALEVMVATHPHADHIGGLIDVLNSFKVEQIWHNGDTSTSQTYSEFMTAANSEGTDIHVAKQGDYIEIGQLTFVILNPYVLGDDTNNNSIVLSLSYGEIDFLFTGDAEHEAENDMLVQSIVPLPEVDILKVGHHGSNTASSELFLDFVSPETAIYMAGEGNSYGHPHEETIINLQEIGADIYGTDVCGTITVTTDGITYDVQKEKECHVEVTPISTTTTPKSITTTPITGSNVQITYIFYDGIVPSVESDEYVEITNLGSASVNLQGRRLVDISKGYPSFTFPSYDLQPGQNIRVYTNEIHPEYGGFSFGSGKAVWNNSDPDTAVLYDAQGNEVSRRSY